MVLPGTLGPWVPGSVADCQTSDPACREREAGAQRGSRLDRLGGSPRAGPITWPPPAAGPAREPARASAQAGRGFPASALPPTAPPAPATAPPYLPSLRFLGGPLCALAPASHPVTEFSPSGSEQTRPRGLGGE